MLAVAIGLLGASGFNFVLHHWVLKSGEPRVASHETGAWRSRDGGTE